MNITGTVLRIGSDSFLYTELGRFGRSILIRDGDIGRVLGMGIQWIDL